MEIPPNMTAINIEEEIREIQAALQKLEGIAGTVGPTFSDTDLGSRPMAPHKIKAAKKRKAKRKRGGPR